MIWNSMKLAISVSVVAAGILGTVVLGQQHVAPGQPDTEGPRGPGAVAASNHEEVVSKRQSARSGASPNPPLTKEDVFRRNRSIHETLARPVTLELAPRVPLGEFLKAIKRATARKDDPGVAIYVDPLGLSEVQADLQTLVEAGGQSGVTLAGRLGSALRIIGLAHEIRDGFLMISSRQSILESRLSQVEEKLDRILELLEKEQR